MAVSNGKHNNPLDGIDDTVTHILFKLERNSKGQVVDELQEDIEEDLLRDVGHKLFNAAKGIYTQTLIEQNFIQDGEVIEIELVQRRNQKEDSSLLCKDIVDLYEYVMGYMDMFPRSVLAKKGKYIEVKSKTQLDLEMVEKSKQEKCREISECRIENIYQELLGEIRQLISDRDSDRKWIHKLEQSTVQLEHHVIELKDNVSRMQVIINNLLVGPHPTVSNNVISGQQINPTPNAPMQSIWDINQSASVLTANTASHDDPVHTQKHAAVGSKVQHNKGQSSRENVVMNEQAGLQSAQGKVSEHVKGVTVAHISSQQGNHTTVLYKSGAQDKFDKLCQQNGERLISKRTSPVQDKSTRDQQTSPGIQVMEQGSSQWPTPMQDKVTREQHTSPGIQVKAQGNGQWPTPAECYGYQQHQQQIRPLYGPGNPVSVQPPIPHTAALRLPCPVQQTGVDRMSRPPPMVPHPVPRAPYPTAPTHSQQSYGSIQLPPQHGMPPVQQGHDGMPLPSGAGNQDSPSPGPSQRQGYPQDSNQHKQGRTFMLQGRKQERGSFLYLQNIYVENETNAVIARSLMDYAKDRGVRIMATRVMRNRLCHDVLGCRILVPESQEYLALDTAMWPENVLCRRWETSPTGGSSYQNRPRNGSSIRQDQYNDRQQPRYEEDYDSEGYHNQW